MRSEFKKVWEQKFEEMPQFGNKAEAELWAKKTYKADFENMQWGFNNPAYGHCTLYWHEPAEDDTDDYYVASVCCLTKEATSKLMPDNPNLIRKKPNLRIVH